MKLLRKVWLLAIGSIVFYSCEKEVDVDLNTASPQVIIEGVITNTPGPYHVQISKTVNFSAANSYPAVSGALVVITDRTSNITDTLSEDHAGVYETLTIQGISGHSYDLFVSSEGQTYTAATTMPFPVAFDSIEFIHRNNFGNNSIRAAPYFQDPAGVANYYTFNAFVNNRRLSSTFVFNDRLSDGKYITQQLFMDSAYIKVGDNVLVNMNCVDKNVWDYFNTLALQAEGGVQAVAPANPTSNISNNALGYFSAYTVQTKTAVAY